MQFLNCGGGGGQEEVTVKVSYQKIVYKNLRTVKTINWEPVSLFLDSSSL